VGSAFGKVDTALGALNTSIVNIIDSNDGTSGAGATWSVAVGTNATVTSDTAIALGGAAATGDNAAAIFLSRQATLRRRPHPRCRRR
jgi:hypothetical protein